MRNRLRRDTASGRQGYFRPVQPVRRRPPAQVRIEDVKEHFLSQFCDEQCIVGMLNDKLQCNCAESGNYEWHWEKHERSSAILTNDKRRVIFHPVHSSGTTTVRGSQPFGKNQHYYWEVKMLTYLYGTDVMVGVGTSALNLYKHEDRYLSILGHETETWGYSYKGFKQHDQLKVDYGSRYGIGSLIGVYLDTCAGTLEYYLNRKPLGVAFTGLKSYELYPMIASTAAQSTIKLTCAISIKSSLQLSCLRVIIKKPKLYKQLKNIPGLFRIYENRFFWLVSKDLDATKRKASDGKLETKRKKNSSPIEWPTTRSPIFKFGADLSCSRHTMILRNHKDKLEEEAKTNYKTKLRSHAKNSGNRQEDLRPSTSNYHRD